MQTFTLHNGQAPSAPWFDVYLRAMRGPRAVKISCQAADSDAAIATALQMDSAPFAAFRAVYAQDDAPNLDCRYGAPMGRAGGNLAHDYDDGTPWRARRVHLDAGGYDRGGAYWGCRYGETRLFAVQDGYGNVAYVDAPNGRKAIEIAKSS